MTITLAEVAVPADLLERYGLKDAWYGDTHSADGKVLETYSAKPRVMYAQWFPPAAQATDPVEELHIAYTDGQVVKVPATEFLLVKP